VGWLLIAVLLAIAIFGPTIWVRRVMSRHAADRPDLQGTGGELARHLLDKFELDTVRVAITEGGDHYDPKTRTVRLSADNHDGRSITAVAVATHEVSHALQHQENYRPFLRRQVIVRAGSLVDSVGSAILFCLSLVGGAVVSPRLLLLDFIAVIVMGLARVIAQATTLPVELDASFNRALPILARDGYLENDDLLKAQEVLKAAAYTYVAGALAQIVNLVRAFRR
jgi:Zn-dependent membrane protease YugP